MNKIREVTIYDIARRVNTSGATVCRALQDHPAISKKTKDKVFAVADEIGYRINPFASNLRSQRSKTIGVLVHELKSNFITSLIAGIEEIATAEGYDIMLSYAGANRETEIKCALNLLRKRVDGIIICHAYDTENFRQFFDKGIPAVFIDNPEETGRPDMVIIDNEDCGFIATSHLIEQGCKKIVHVTGTLDRQDHFQRFTGYKNALAQHGIPFDKSRVIIEEGNLRPGIDAAAQILALRHLPDGIFVADDMMAASCMRELIQNGVSVPDDIAVVGFNNDPICELIEPMLTSINYPGEEIGRIAVTDVLNHLRNNQAKPNKLLLRAELIIRGSSLKNRLIV